MYSNIQPVDINNRIIINPPSTSSQVWYRSTVILATAESIIIDLSLVFIVLFFLPNPFITISTNIQLKSLELALRYFFVVILVSSCVLFLDYFFLFALYREIYCSRSNNVSRIRVSQCSGSHADERRRICNDVCAPHVWKAKSLICSF